MRALDLLEEYQGAIGRRAGVRRGIYQSPKASIEPFGLQEGVMPFLGIPNPIKGLRNQFRKAQGYLFSTPEKDLYAALLEGDEEKAIKVYTEVPENGGGPAGVALITEFDPSSTSRHRQYEYESALHLSLIHI